MRKPGDLDGNDTCHPELARPDATERGVPPRPVVDPEGRRWPSLSAAARAYRISCAAVRGRVQAGGTGWRWAEPQAPAEHGHGLLIIMLTRAAWLAKAQGKPDEAERLLGWARAVRDGDLP